VYATQNTYALAKRRWGTGSQKKKLKKAKKKTHNAVLLLIKEEGTVLGFASSYVLCVAYTYAYSLK
jgi:hypothetical protein